MKAIVFKGASHAFKTITILALVFLTACQAKEKTEIKEAPNVILIVADDMAYGDLSLVNEGITRTPNLDQFANESVWFTKGYSAAPVCAPARAALLTGLHPHQTGCVTLGMQRFPEISRITAGIPTMANVFAENGYATGLIGKWHCGDGPDYHPMKRGFQEFEGFLGYMVNTYENYELDINNEITEFRGKYLTDDLTERAIGFVTRHSGHPFFLHLAHYAPHRPLGAPEEMVDYYLAKGHSRNTATIYAMIEAMDLGIGQLIEKLDQLGIRENTIVIFLSDNGPDPLPGKRDNMGLKGTKYTVYEGGLHVPFFIQWQGTFEAMKNHQIVHFTDVFPTLVDLCELQLSESIHFAGGSLEEVLRQEGEGSLPEQRYWQWNRGVPYYTHNAAMREGKWKLVRPYVTRDVPGGVSAEEPVLYDLESDPYEEIDVSEANGSIYKTMSVMLEEWCREVEFDRLNNKKDN